jgi:hypothetical protein
MAAETLALHGITESSTFESLMDFLQTAHKALAKVERALGSSPKTIFPNIAMARAWCERNPLDAGRSYQINPDGIGRCTISICEVVERV